MLPDRASKTSMRAGVVSSGRRPRKACLAVIVTLGATALAAVLGKKVSSTEARTSKLAHEPSGTAVVATYHSSAVLRVQDHDARLALRAALLADLQRAAQIAAPGGAPRAPSPARKPG